jgi:hypothetical protein
MSLHNLIFPNKKATPFPAVAGNGDIRNTSIDHAFKEVI